MLRYLVLLGAGANLFGNAVYVWDMIYGKTRPNLVSWTLWTLAPLVASFAAFSAGSNYWAVLPTFMVGFCPLLVVITALLKRSAIWKPRIFDYVCGGLSISAFVLLLLTKNTNVAIIFAILSDGLAALPTLKKAWQFPESESGIAYTTALFNILTTFVALGGYSFSETAFPIYNTLLNMTLSFSVYRKRIFNTKIDTSTS